MPTAPIHPSSSVAMRRSRAAFTLIEVLVASCVSVLLGGIIYTMGSEALFSFSRNISLSRCYFDARSTIDRLGAAMQSAGHTPVLINEDGTLWTSTQAGNVPGTNPTSAAGVRFYGYNTQPSYHITSCNSSGSTMTIALPNAASLPKKGDLVTINAVGFQGIVSNTPTGTTSTSLSFTDMYGVSQTIGTLCNPDITTSTDITTLQSYCLLFNRVAFIAVSTPALSNPAAAPAIGNVVAATSTELRYYSDANVLTKYKVLAHLVIDQSDTQEKFIVRPRPFEILASPTVTTTLCVQSPDYTNRTSVISDATTFTRMQTSLASRCPLLLQGPY